MLRESDKLTSILCKSLILFDSFQHNSEAGEGELTCTVINDATKQPVPVKIVDNDDNTYSVEVTPDLAGTYTTNLTYGGLKVPFSKKTVISSPVDVSKVQVEGLQQSEYRECLILIGCLISFYNDLN